MVHIFISNRLPFLNTCDSIILFLTTQGLPFASFQVFENGCGTSSQDTIWIQDITLQNGRRSCILAVIWDNGSTVEEKGNFLQWNYLAHVFSSWGEFFNFKMLVDEGYKMLMTTKRSLQFFLTNLKYNKSSWNFWSKFCDIFMQVWTYSVQYKMPLLVFFYCRNRVSCKKSISLSLFTY